jgi:hypothetical protein
MPGFMPSQPSSLPTNSSLRLAVLEDLADGAGGQRRVQRHRQTPPAIQMAKSAISQCARVLGRCSATAVAGLARPWALQVRGHAARLVHAALRQV